MARVDLGTPDNRNITPFTITLRIKLEAFGPAKAGAKMKFELGGEQWTMDHLSPAELLAFKLDFVHVVTKQWSDKIYIALPEGRPPQGLPNDWYLKFLSRELIRWKPCVQCKLNIELVENDYDWRVEICKPSPGQPYFRSFMVKPTKRKEFEDAGWPHGMLSVESVNVRTRLRTVKEHAEDHWKDAQEYSFFQATAGHEVGHMLGLQHVNYSHPLCHEQPDQLHDHNDPICYGDTIFTASDAMGNGSWVRAHHGRPWLIALQNLTGHKVGWQLTTNPLALGCATPESLPEKVISAGKQWLHEALNNVSPLRAG